jgi:hypothetical protein
MALNPVLDPIDPNEGLTIADAASFDPVEFSGLSISMPFDDWSTAAAAAAAAAAAVAAATTLLL